jgi:hypothetical protein
MIVSIFAIKPIIKHHQNEKGIQKSFKKRAMTSEKTPLKKKIGGITERS